MPKKKQPTPYDITVRTKQDRAHGFAHAWIEIEAALWSENAAPAGYSLAEFLDGRRWVAGILGRLATLLAEDLATERREHHCRGWFISGYGEDECSEVPDTWGLRDPRTEEEHLVGLELSIPFEKRREWVTKVKDLLAEITAAEAWQPSPADEARWRGVTQPDHDTAPAVPRRARA